MSAGHWLKREFYLRQTRKVFGHYQDIYGKETSHRATDNPAPDEPVVKAQSWLQHMQSKGLWVGVLLAIALAVAYCVEHFG